MTKYFSKLTTLSRHKHSISVVTLVYYVAVFQLVNMSFHITKCEIYLFLQLTLV